MVSNKRLAKRHYRSSMLYFRYKPLCKRLPISLQNSRHLINWHFTSEPHFHSNINGIGTNCKIVQSKNLNQCYHRALSSDSYSKLEASHHSCQCPLPIPLSLYVWRWIAVAHKISYPSFTKANNEFWSQNPPSGIYYNIGICISWKVYTPRMNETGAVLFLKSASHVGGQ